MKKIKIAILPGDGIGQDVTHASVPIFQSLNIPVELSFGDIGWNFWVNEGDAIPSRTWELIQKVDAVLLGATTSKPEKEAYNELSDHLKSNRPSYVSPIVQLRQRLDLYANVRPCFNIKSEGKNFDFVVIRENTEGLYAGLDYYPLPDDLTAVIKSHKRWQHISDKNAACSIRLQTEEGLTRLFNFAFNYATQEKYGRVTFADKPNVLRKSSAFARDIFEKIANQYPEIKSDIHNVDAVALWMVKRPEEFGIVVAENMFGDILSDLGAGVMGGLGFAASANIGLNGCYFEPVHGSAPRVKKNTANPAAMFLTISLLLKNFGLLHESDLIKQSVQQVIREQKYVTYDLGGKATTEEMASRIIEIALSPTKTKRISFLATGSEIVNGDVQDTNSTFFAKSINSKGGNIYQHLQTSDKKHEIAEALRYLLNKNDAVIVTGGLGPTSDDTTRFAISETTNTSLEFDEKSWQAIVQRLKSFNIEANDANKQQALFPPNAEIYLNDFGTAPGCYIYWHEKHIFMLPGPPKECQPIFNKYVLEKLQKEEFFCTNETYRWLTLGLIEGEISPKIDSIGSRYSCDISYKWDYPYLEIKVMSSKKIESLIEEINNLILPNIISHNGKTAWEILQEILHNFQFEINILDKVTHGSFAQKISDKNIQFIDSLNIKDKSKPIFLMDSTQPICDQTSFVGSVTFKCYGYINDKIIHLNEITTPNRSQEILEYANSYFAWQLAQFIRIL